MDSQRWVFLQELFHQAEVLPKEQWRAFLENACPNDDNSVDEVISLLEENVRQTSLLDAHVSEVARNILNDSPEQQPIHTIGPYRILNKIGQGGMGVVYLAARSDLHNHVAIKLLPNAWMSPSRRDRFAQEARTLSRLIHPSIARLYDAGTLDDGTPWFAMEYVDGVPITEYCEERSLPIAERLRIFRSVCEAVQFAHSQAILHRDLKPANIFVNQNGEVRLLDFGIAKQLDVMEEDADLTRTGLRLATPAYAAPEQLRGDPPAIQGDVYSLGATLHELLMGPQASPLPADIDLLCLTARHEDVLRRYQSVDALIRDIDHYLKTEPLDARPDDLVYKIRKFVSRNRRSIAAASLVIAVLAAGGAYSALRITEERDRALAEAARTQRVKQFMLHLFEGGDSQAGPAADLRVITLVDRSAREARALSTDPSIQSELYLTLGDIYQNLGRPDRADEHFRSSLAIRRTLPGHNELQISESLMGLGLLRVEEGKFEEANKLIAEALESAKRLRPADPGAISRATSALGRVLTDRGDYNRAIALLEEALRLQPQSANPTQEQATGLMRLAGAHFHLAHYDESEALSKRALEIYQRMYGPSHPMAADAIINLGAIADNRARYSEAERFYRQALAINRDYYGRSHVEVAASLRGVAKALVAQKRLNEAEPLLQEALTIRERAYGAVHPNVASTLSSLGTLALEQGKLDEAEQCFRRMLAIYQAVYGEKHNFTVVALGNLASVYLERKDYSHAEKTLRDVLQRYSKLLPADHVDVGIVRVKLGRTLLLQNHYQEAKEYLVSGLEILGKKTESTAPWVIKGRKDLATIHEILEKRAN